MDKEQKFEKEYQESQRKFFEEWWVRRWEEKFSGKDDLKDIILKMKYDDFYNINNAFGKLDKALQICDFLYNLSKSKPSQDTEKIIIAILVSCAEAIYRTYKPTEDINENLVKGFFKPVEEKINYKIRGYVGDEPLYKKTFEAIDILYLIRNDFIHNGNFTGRFFRNCDLGDDYCELGTFHFSEKENKVGLIEAYSECYLTYREFQDIFLESFIENIREYCDKK